MNQLDMQLVKYAKVGDLGNVEQHLENHAASLSANNIVALKGAIENGHADVVKFLLEKNFDKFPLDARLIGISGSAETANVLLNYWNVDRMTYRESFLNECTLQAAMYGKTDTIELLMHKGANINQMVATREICTTSKPIVSFWVLSTPLIQASKYNRVETVKFLVDNGADLFRRDRYNALDYAKRNGNKEIQQILSTVMKQYKKEHPDLFHRMFACCFSESKTNEGAEITRKAPQKSELGMTL